MNTQRKRIAIIPARGGSKGVKGKNWKILGDKPLIGWTIDVAKRSECFDTIIVSTDHQEIANAAAAHGVEVPQLRPSDLAVDRTPMLDVIKYEIGQHPGYDTICLLQPTTPFRTVDTIKGSIKTFEEDEYDSVLSVLEVPDKYNPKWVFVEKEEGGIELFSGDAQPISRRQDLPKAYIREGSVYVFSPQTIARYGNIYGKRIGHYVVDGVTVNIDTPEDFSKAEEVIKLGLVP